MMSWASRTWKGSLTLKNQLSCPSYLRINWSYISH